MVMANRLPGVLVFGSALAFAACGGEGITLPPEGEAAHISVIRGDEQQDFVNSVLGDSVVVEVTDVRDRAVAGATVNFTFPDGDATASPATAITNSAGIAWAKVTLGTQVGPVAGVAEVPVNPGITPVRATFTAEALPAGANRIARVSGDEQEGPVGTDLLAPLVVQVTDEHGNPIPNVTVDWSVEGGGSVSAITTLTGENGQASVTRTLGPAAGPQAAFATAGGLAGSPVSFSHIATAGSASRVNIIDGDDQTAPPGATLERPLVVEVVDEANNPVVNAAVEWVVAQGGGSATPPSNRTDGQGRASTQWTLGPAPGNNILNAVVSGVGRAEFSAVGERSASSVSITSDSPDPSLPGQAVQVAVTVSGEGGTPTGTVSVSGEGAASPCSITLSSGSGSCEIVFTQPGSRQLTATYNGDGRFEGDTDTESHQVSAPVNLPPSAQPDAYSTNEDAALNVAAPGVLANDTDPENGSLTANKVTDPAHGSVTLNANGSFTYTPEADYFGDDSFTYQASDGNSTSSAVTVTITVNAVNDAPSFTGGGDATYPANATEPETIFGWATNIRSGPPNESSQTLSFEITTSNDALFSMLPTISVADGTLSFRGNGSIGSANVTVRLKDNGGGTDTSTAYEFTITFVAGALRM
jgi:VCBS repeat-containing protein